MIIYKTDKVNIRDVKVGQKVTINGMLAEHNGIQKVKVSGFGKVEKRVFKARGINTYKYFSLNDGLKKLESEVIVLQ